MWTAQSLSPPLHLDSWHRTLSGTSWPLPTVSLPTDRIRPEEGRVHPQASLTCRICNSTSRSVHWVTWICPNRSHSSRWRASLSLNVHLECLWGMSRLNCRGLSFWVLVWILFWISRLCLRVPHRLFGPRGRKIVWCLRMEWWAAICFCFCFSSP